jgi:cytochrome c
LRNVFGHGSGSDPRFPYSDALKKARLIWDAKTLDLWLANPDALVPGNDMSFRLDEAGERAAIIAYLKQMSHR